ncbi:Predicted CoA-binding protein [Microbacterium sp. cf046]|uniref:CoA-binding protein n=1 Tax=Microbacterium sp. cf046 TaxID=1761803 RepID=UPI0008ED01F5|nr:CoA-binding protein [Microbacterium sp. cf046]SFR93351.1 Predicted CoA-binding protein [Microbacterium sp. cf046]
MPTPDEILRTATHVVVKDYPSHDVPDALTSAGFVVTVYDGPDEQDVVVSELAEGAIVRRPVGRYPDQADVLYVYRPIAEIEGIIAEAHRLRAHTVWRQPPPGSSDPDSGEWRRRIEAAGLSYVDSPAIEQAAARIHR